MKSPSIDQYLISTSLFIIDEFNERYKNIENKNDLKEIADNGFSEADLTVRLGYPFRQMAKFNMQGPDTTDIVVEEKDFLIEVKFLRNWKSTGGKANKILWSELKKDFDWLFEEIKKGNKGKRAVVFGWFNAVERLSQIVQLGKGKGGFPDIDEDKIRLFPFLNRHGNKTRDIFYMYPKAYEKLPIYIPGFADETVECIFLGQETDKFHMAIYY
ncbi:hypothetical protein [Thermaerobacillus caldiproteolyticus]|uniref:hypothetical protein n=1 Tax=Thermaerobacillus caldiproteolyticus TaxID=247480 RepID=UPI0018F1F79F|nr:hypothetical protein [Anoxybacillus caldiproteolyticus]